MKNLSKKDIILGVSTFLILSTIGFYIIKKEKANETVVVQPEPTYSSEQVQTDFKEIVVDIIGEVKKPGIVRLKEGQRVIDAIEKAGGATINASLDDINLAFKLSDGQQIIIPKKEEIKVNAAPTKKSYTKSTSKSSKINTSNKYISNNIGKAIVSNTISKPSSSTNSDSDIININTASIAELDKLPGIGEATAKKIIDYREKNGTFKAIEDIMKVGGIGKSKFQNIKEKITV